MKKLVLITLLFLFSFVTYSQSFQWAKSMSGSMDSEGYAVTVDGAGNVYSTGYFSGTVDFDPGSGVTNLTAVNFKDFYISKLDAAGNFIWAKQFGAAGDEVGFSIKADFGGNIYVTGYFGDPMDFDPGPGTVTLTPSYRDVFIAKYDTDCNLIWARNVGGTNLNLGDGLAIDASGDVYVTGFLRGTTDFDPGSGVYNLTSAGDEDIFVLKLDVSGNFAWAKVYGDPSAAGDYGYDITVDGSGNVYSIGNFHGTLDFDPGPGTIDVTSPVPGSAVIISKYDASGNFVWAKSFGGADDYGYAIGVDAIGNVYTTGYISGPTDFDPGPGTYNLGAFDGSFDTFISKLDVNGNFVWAKSVKGTQIGIGQGLAVDGVGNVYIAGMFEDTADFDPGVGIFNMVAPRVGTGMYSDAYVLKLNSSGSFAWAKRMGGTQNDSGNGIALDPFGGAIYTTGSFTDTADFDPGAGTFNLTTSGSKNIFIHKMSQPVVGIEEHDPIIPVLSIFPNPASDRLMIQVTKPIVISIVNVFGQELLNSKIESSKNIDVSFLSNGIYFVKDMNSNTGIKFIKQ